MSTQDFIAATYETELEEDVETVKLRLYYSFTAGSPGVMYMRNGDPGYPADPDEVELDFVQRETATGWETIPDADPIIAWAQTYLEDHLDEIAEDQAGRDEDAREQARDLRDDR